MIAQKKPPVLIMEPSYAGSLAAVRLLGRARIPVTVGGRGLLQAARWSRLSSGIWPVDTDRGQEAFLADMKSVTARSKGHVLLATSDMAAWLMSRHSETLKDDFVVYVPAFSVIESIVDKARLWSVCKTARIPTIDSWFPRDSTDLVTMGSDLRYPLLIKPRSHVYNEFFTKGIVVRTPEALATEFAGFLRKVTAGSFSATPPPEATPILQFFVEEAVENVVSISGFIDRSGTRSIVRASRKTLQRSRPIGLGLAFESVSVDPALADSAIRLCRELKYFGVFEIEFIELAGVWHLIDFNPRFYQEMALDIAAGAPLPLLAYLDACGDEAALDRLIARGAAEPNPKLGFTDMVSLLLRFCANPLAERRALRWHWNMRGRLVDATFDLRDPLPSIVHALAEVWHGLARLRAALVRKKKARSAAQRPASAF